MNNLSGESPLQTDPTEDEYDERYERRRIGFIIGRTGLRGCTKRLDRANAIDELLRPVKLFQQQTACVFVQIDL